jgi:hypothetical protein
MAASITHLVSVEVIKGLVSTLRMGPPVAVMWIETVINVAVKVVGAVKPGADSDEHAAVEPLGPVVSVWRAGVRGGILVAIRASWFCSDIDRDLRRCRSRNAQQSRNQDGQGKKFPIAHEFLLTLEKATQMPKL